MTPDEIKQMSKRLTGLEIEQERQDADLHNLRDLAEILKYEKKLTNIGTDSLTGINGLVVDITLTSSPKAATHGYVIRLMFNTKMPSEWSDEAGGGWRENGGGMCYPSLEQAKHRLQQLQAQWADYPLEIAER